MLNDLGILDRLPILRADGFLNSLNKGKVSSLFDRVSSFSLNHDQHDNLPLTAFCMMI